MCLVLSRRLKAIQNSSPGCLFGPGTRDDDTLSLTPSSGTPSSGTPVPLVLYL